jgi:hypothetical protein
MYDDGIQIALKYFGEQASNEALPGSGSASSEGRCNACGAKA